MVTNAQKGNLFLLKLPTTYNGTDYTTTAALRSTGLTINNAPVDITNKDGNGWQELMAGGGVKSASATGDGVFANDATQIRLVTASMATTHWNARLVDEAGNTYTGAWNIDTVELSGDSNAETTYSVSLSSAGEIVFVAA